MIKDAQIELANKIEDVNLNLPHPNAHIDFCGVHPKYVAIEFRKWILIGCINIKLDCDFEKDGSRISRENPFNFFYYMNKFWKYDNFDWFFFQFALKIPKITL